MSKEIPKPKEKDQNEANDIAKIEEAQEVLIAEGVVVEGLVVEGVVEEVDVEQKDSNSFNIQSEELKGDQEEENKEIKSIPASIPISQTDQNFEKMLKKFPDYHSYKKDLNHSQQKAYKESLKKNFKDFVLIMNKRSKQYENYAKGKFSKIFAMSKDQLKNYNKDFGKREGQNFKWHLNSSQISTFKDPSPEEAINAFKSYKEIGENNTQYYPFHSKYLQYLSKKVKSEIQIDVLMEFPMGIKMFEEDREQYIHNYKNVVFKQEKSVIVAQICISRAKKFQKFVQLEKEVMLAKVLYPDHIIYPCLCFDEDKDEKIDTLFNINNYMKSEDLSNNNLIKALKQKRMIFLHYPDKESFPKFQPDFKEAYLMAKHKFKGTSLTLFSEPLGKPPKMQTEPRRSSKRDFQLEQLGKKLKEKDNVIKDLERELKQKDTDLKEKGNETKDLERELKQKDTDLKEKGNETKDLERELKQKDTDLKEKDNVIKYLERELKQKDTHLKEKGNETKDLERELKQKDTDLKEKDNVIKDLERELKQKDTNLKDKDIELGKERSLFENLLLKFQSVKVLLQTYKNMEKFPEARTLVDKQLEDLLKGVNLK